MGEGLETEYLYAGNILCLCLLGGRRGRYRRRPKRKNDVGDDEVDGEGVYPGLKSSN